MTNSAGGKVNFNLCNNVPTDCTDKKSLFVQADKCNLITGDWTHDKLWNLDCKIFIFIQQIQLHLFWNCLWEMQFAQYLKCLITLHSI